MHRKSYILGLLSPMLLIGLSGCGGSSPSTTPTPNLVFSTDLTSIAKKLFVVNSGTNTVGFNDLTGTATINGATVQVEVTANVNYTNGSGPFLGSLTLTYPDGSILAFEHSGMASYNSSTTVTSLTAHMTVIGGTGAASNVKGEGSYVGSRSTALGGPVHLEVSAYTHQ